MSRITKFECYMQSGEYVTDVELDCGHKFRDDGGWSSNFSAPEGGKVGDELECRECARTHIGEQQAVTKYVRKNPDHNGSHTMAVRFGYREALRKLGVNSPLLNETDKTEKKSSSLAPEAKRQLIANVLLSLEEKKTYLEIAKMCGNGVTIDDVDEVVNWMRWMKQS